MVVRAHAPAASVRVLLVDDDPAFRRHTSVGLTDAGIDHDAASSAAEALRFLEARGPDVYDVVLLDVEMPGRTGWELLRELRELGHDVPVIFLTVHEALEERVKGLELGADDYIVKPCQLEELRARLHAVVRRRNRDEIVKVGDLRLDLALRKAERSGNGIDLSPREFELLTVLARSAGTAVSRRELMRRVWGADGDSNTNVLEVHVWRLRKKLEQFGPPVIETVRGVGYRMQLA